MHTRFLLFVSAFTLSTLLASPVFALSMPFSETMVAAPVPTLASCQEQALPVYRLSLEGALSDMRALTVDEWKEQVTFRVNAASRTRRTAVQRALQQAGTQLDASLDTFYKTQTNGVDADVRVAVRALEIEDIEASELALDRWSKQTVSFRTLDTVLARMERTLRQYATARDATTISRVWNETRKQAQTEFTQARLNAREVFVQDMNDCLAGVVDEVVAEQQETPSATEKPVTHSENAGKGTSSEVRFLEVQLARSGGEPILTCGQYTVEYIGFVQMSQPGASFTYHLERSDGARTPDAVVTTNAYGAANVFYNWTLSRPMSGWVRIVITEPYAVAWTPSHITGFTAVEKPGCTVPTGTNNQTTPADPSITKPSAMDQQTPAPSSSIRAQAIVSSKAEVALCGNYLFQIKGRVSIDTPTTITYRWERSDGVTSPEHKMRFTAAGDHDVASEAWNLGGTYAGWVKLHVLSPVDIFSNTASLNISQMCK